MTVFEAYITNLGKYAEGQFVGETLKFPATTEEVQSLLKNIGVDGVRYEEFFITAFDGDVMGLYDYLTEYENLDELNHLAHLISELDSDEIETLEAALNKGDHTSSVADIINLVHNLDCYDLHPGVTDDETLGRIYVEDMELLDVPDNVLPYFDFEKNTVRISKSYQRINRKDVITDPKTEDGNRTIVMPVFLSDEMQDYISKLYGIGENDRIFEITKSYLHHEMDRGSKAAGVKRIRIHDLRHSHVSLLINQGFSAVEIAKRVGHKSVDITYIYAHVFPTTQKEMADKLDIERNKFDE